MTTPTIPEGYVLVPAIPTKEMVAAGYASIEYDIANPYMHIGETVYLAMLAAAPLVKL